MKATLDTAGYVARSPISGDCIEHKIVEFWFCRVVSNLVSRISEKGMPEAKRR